MAFQAPEQIGADGRLLTVLRRWLERPSFSAPGDHPVSLQEEHCALLLGWRDGPFWQLEQLWPCCNVWPEPRERSHRFAIDPREQLLAQQWARRRGLDLLGAAHSHPASPPRPSASDCRLTAALALMLIHGPERPGQPMESVCWWLEEPGAEPRRLAWAPGRCRSWRMAG